MSFIYSILGNYSAAIIVFTLVTKLIFLPVNYKTSKESARMRLLNPKLEKIRKSFANNPQRQQEETQKLYQQEGINPGAACLPALIQMFLAFGIIDVVYKPMTHIMHIAKGTITSAVEIASGLATSAGGKAITMRDLRNELRTMEQFNAAPESFSKLGTKFGNMLSDFSEQFTLFGANLGKTPTLHPDSWTKEAVILAAIPFIACIAQLFTSLYSTLYSKKTNPNQAQGCMTITMFIMPLFSLWFSFQVPAGVGYYWIWSSIISVIITILLNNYFTDERVLAINEKEKEKARIYAEKHPGKKSFTQRLLEQSQAAAEQQNNASKYKANGEKYSRSELNKRQRELINEARKRMAEKYGDTYDENNED